VPLDATRRLTAFASLEKLEKAAEAAPELYAHATTFVHCDAEDIQQHRAKALAARLLQPNGLSFQLRNNGASDARGLMEGWRKLAPAGGGSDRWRHSTLEPLIVSINEGSEPLVSASHVAVRSHTQRSHPCATGGLSHILLRSLRLLLRPPPPSPLTRTCAVYACARLRAPWRTLASTE
jgi:hypothetical protein